MKKKEFIMGMPVVVEIIDTKISEPIIDEVFNYFRDVDERFSTFKPTSEISEINSGKIKRGDYSPEMREIFTLAEATKLQTSGYFDIRTPAGSYDPSGIVKGWAIHNAANLLRQFGVENFYIEAGGDIELQGHNSLGKPWSVGIRDPFDATKIIKTLELTSGGIATSGTSMKGQHIYSPQIPNLPITEIISITVIGPNIYEADRIATAAFAMGKIGIDFIHHQTDLEAYMINQDGIATMTSGFSKFSPTHA